MSKRAAVTVVGLPLCILLSLWAIAWECPVPPYALGSCEASSFYPDVGRVGSKAALPDGYAMDLSVPSEEGALTWARRAGGSGRDYGHDIAILADGSAVVTGKIAGTATFGPGEPNETILFSAGDDDVFVAKYNPDGTLAWAKRAGGSDYDAASRIACLDDGTALVIGTFTGPAVFGPDEPNQTVLTFAGGQDVFVARYNPDGTFAWVKAVGGSHYDAGSGIACLDDGTALVTGSFTYGAVFGALEPNQTELYSAGPHDRDLFVAKYNPDGTLAWAKRAGGSGEDGGSAIALLEDDSTLVTGQFSGMATFGPGESNQTVLVASAGGYGDAFIAKYNPDGTLAWAKRAGGSWGSGIAVLEDDSTLVTGQFSGMATFGPGEPNETIRISAGATDMFLAKYNPDGTLAWAKRAGGGGEDGAFGIAALADGCALVTGDFEQTATFNPGEVHQTALTSTGSSDMFIAKYNPDGTLAWAKRAGGSGEDSGNGIAWLNDGSAVVTGDFAGTATFGPGEPDQAVLVSGGSADVFVAKYSGTGAVLGRPDVDGSGEVDAVDVQLVINEALGVDTGFDCDINQDGNVDALDVQLVINAALGIL